MRRQQTLPALGLANTDTERCRKTLAVHTWSFLLVLYTFIRNWKTYDCPEVTGSFVVLVSEAANVFRTGARHDPDQVDSSPIITTLDAVVPIALAGLGVFHVLDGDKNQRVQMILNIIPGDRRTVLLMFGRPQDEGYMRAYLAKWPNTIELLNMIESWMIHGTDHWFVRPSIWASIPRHRQRAILEAYRTIQRISETFRCSQSSTKYESRSLPTWRRCWREGSTDLEAILARERQKLIKRDPSNHRRHVEDSAGEECLVAHGG
jgi:hypothetical protein